MLSRFGAVRRTSSKASLLGSTIPPASRLGGARRLSGKLVRENGQRDDKKEVGKGLTTW
jgi:hypothetical protein